jgi:hypothetical protein
MRTYYCYPLDQCGKILARVEVEASNRDDAVAAGWGLVAANAIYTGLEVWLESVRVFPELGVLGAG